MTTTEERELLELAAKAMKFDWQEWVGDTLYVWSGTIQMLWRPLTDDGDCARMEAALGIDVGWSIGSVECFHVDVGYIAESYEEHAGDKQAARRMASLRVAAEIGRAMG